MKILVTGCAGYVGSVLCRRLLSKGYEVVGLDNFHKGHGDALVPLMTDPNFKLIYGDVTQIKDVNNAYKEEPDGIIHLAAIVGFPACRRQPGLSKLVNVEGTRNVVNLSNKDCPLVYASTGSVYGKVEDKCYENSPTVPLTEYGQDKLEAERIVLEEDNTVAFRFATGYGVSPCMRVNLLVNDLVYQAVKTRSFIMFEADARRTFVHVQDMATCFIMGLEGLMQKKPMEKVYNAGSSSSNMTKRELAEYIKEKTKCHVFYGNTGKDLDQRDYEVDYTKIEEFGFKPSYTLQQGIDELIKVTPLLQGIHRYE